MNQTNDKLIIYQYFREYSQTQTPIAFPGAHLSRMEVESLMTSPPTCCSR